MSIVSPPPPYAQGGGGRRRGGGGGEGRGGGGGGVGGPSLGAHLWNCVPTVYHLFAGWVGLLQLVFAPTKCVHPLITRYK